MRKTGVYFLVCTALLMGGASSVSSQTTAQTTFELEGKVDSPITIPAEVIAVLKSDKRLDGCFKTEGAGVDEQAWFEAAEFDLNDDQRTDLIIKPKHACLFGANQGPFWIFQNVPDGYQKVFAADGLQLKILPSRINSFRTIEISKSVGMRALPSRFQFSKGSYRAAK